MLPQGVAGIRMGRHKVAHDVGSGQAMSELRDPTLSSVQKSFVGVSRLLPLLTKLFSMKFELFVISKVGSPILLVPPPPKRKVEFNTCMCNATKELPLGKTLFKGSRTKSL